MEELCGNCKFLKNKKTEKYDYFCKACMSYKATDYWNNMCPGPSCSCEERERWKIRPTCKTYGFLDFDYRQAVNGLAPMVRSCACIKNSSKKIKKKKKKK